MLLPITTFLLHLFLSTTTSAHPLNPDSAPVTSASILTCTSANLTDACTRHHATPLGNNNCLPLDGTASSIRLDQGLDCIFYANSVCSAFSTKAQLRIIAPAEETDLAAKGWGDGHRVRGFNCVAVAVNTTDYAASSKKTDGGGDKTGRLGVEMSVSSGTKETNGAGRL